MTHELTDPESDAAPAPAVGAEPATSSCCSTAEQSTCCDAHEKPGCCGAGATVGGGCGCR